MGFVLRCIVAAALCLAGSAGLPAHAQADAPTRVLARAEAALAAGGSGPPVAWQPVALPHDWSDTFPGYSGIVWYRLTFELPMTGGSPGGMDDAHGGLLGIYLHRACTNAQVFLNGEQVGGSGLLTGHVTRNCYYPQLAALPRAVLRPGTNELRIRLAGFAANEVSARQRAAGLSEIRVGTLAALQPLYDSQLFWNVTVAQIIAATVAALGLAMLGLAAVRRRDSYLMYFGLFTTGWALISTRLFVQHVPMTHHATEVLICSAFPPVLACAYVFLMRFVDRRHRWVDWLLAAQAVLVPLVLVAVGPRHLLTAASAVYNAVAVEFLLCVVYFFRVAWRGHRREFWLMGGVLLVAIVLAGIEIALQNDWLPLPRVHVIHFAMPFLFVVIGIRLIQMFVQALNRAETANQELEARVAEKSREIERSYEQLTALRTAQAAQSERQRIASDLHDDLGAKLLTIAQVAQAGPRAGHGDADRGPDRERIAGMARQALDEMRLSVRGMTGEPAPAAEVLADWRAETVTRLGAAGFDAHWDAQEPPPELVLPARTHVQLTRVLREAVSNAIRHSGGTACTVRIVFEPGLLHMEVADDGRGLDAARERASTGGHGLPGIERRVRKLAGRHTLRTAPGGGTLLALSVPLLEQSANMDAP